MEFALPDELTSGANLRGSEYGWTPESFRLALAKAPGMGYACYGGQFQFRPAGGSITEMYWLETEWQERTSAEPWEQFALRSCEETLKGFNRLLAATDFRNQAHQWKHLQPLLETGWDPMKDLVFVAYFESEAQWEIFQAEQRTGRTGRA